MRFSTLLSASILFGFSCALPLRVTQEQELQNKPVSAILKRNPGEWRRVLGQTFKEMLHPETRYGGGSDSTEPRPIEDYDLEVVNVRRWLATQGVIGVNGEVPQRALAHAAKEKFGISEDEVAKVVRSIGWETAKRGTLMKDGRLAGDFA